MAKTETEKGGGKAPETTKKDKKKEGSEISASEEKEMIANIVACLTIMCKERRLEIETGTMSRPVVGVTLLKEGDPKKARICFTQG